MKHLSLGNGEKRIRYKIHCKKCGYEYKIEVIDPPRFEQCPNCGNSIPLDEMEINWGKRGKNNG